MTTDTANPPPFPPPAAGRPPEPHAPLATFEQLHGSGRGLWADDAEFERFLADIRAVRAEKD